MKVLDFCGSIVNVGYSEKYLDGLIEFKKFDNGFYKGNDVYLTKHPNILKGLIVGKKSWGLWINEWSDGIADDLFTLDEILSEFEIRGIDIPEPLLNDFINRINKKRIKVSNKIYIN